MDNSLKLNELVLTRWDKREIDPDTNLIALPEGYFWRVGKYGANDPDCYTFSLHKTETRKSWWGKEITEVKRVIRTYVYHPEDRNAFISACHELLDRLKTNLVRDEYVGDYPPKKMI